MEEAQLGRCKGRPTLLSRDVVLVTSPFRRATEASDRENYKRQFLDHWDSPAFRLPTALTLFVRGISVDVDSGASISINHSDWYSRLRMVTTPDSGPVLRAADGVRVKPCGYCTARVFINYYI